MSVQWTQPEEEGIPSGGAATWYVLADLVTLAGLLLWAIWRLL
jgi:hypothetical protein